jgi:PAS domain S-box-containing protein
VTHVDYHAIMRQRMKLVLEGQSVPALEKKIVRPDGTLRDVEVNAKLYSNRERTKVEVILRNVTERKQSEEAFRESEVRFRRIYESNMLAIAFSGLDGRMVEANQAFCDLVGYSPQEVRRGSLQWQEIIPSEWRAIYDSLIDEIKSNETAHVREMEILKKNNQKVPVVFGAAVMRGTRFQIATFVVDASDMRRREQDLKRKEEKYRFMIDNAVEAMIAVDSSGKIVHFNNRAQALFGYTVRDALGRPLISLMAERSHEGFRRIRMSDSDLKRRTAELIAIRKDGSELPIEVILSSWNTSDESLVTAQVRDITEQKRAQDTSASSMTEERTRRTEAEIAERRARILAEASATLASSLDYVATLTGLARLAVPSFADLCAVYVLNEDNTIRRLATEHVNPARLAVLLQIDRSYPSTLKDIYGPGGVLRSGKALWRAQVSESFLMEMVRNTAHLQLLRQVGLKSYLIVPMIARNRTLGVIEFGITESNRYYSGPDLTVAEDLAQRAGIAVDNANLYREAQEALFTAQKAISSRDELIAIVSHDLKNPLSAISLGASTALRSLDGISHSANRMNRLITDLLDIASIDARNLSIRREPTEVSRLVDTVWQVLEPTASSKEIHFRREIQAGLPLIDIDPSRIEQVLSNLVSNSIKFTPKGGTISIHAERHGEEVLFTVSDTGPGIQPEHFDHIFDRHWQVKETAHLGTGLGLAIAKGIIESHGGQIWVTSNPGQGTSFHFTLGAK